jgi:DNA-directed RNA polymerase specialized sigma subunit
MSAFATYDPAKGASFKTHAETRIKGAMQDHITGIHSHSTGGVDPYHLREAKKFMQRKSAEQPAMPSSDDLPPHIPTSKK